MVQTAHGPRAKALIESACQRIMVDEHPARVLGLQVLDIIEVSQREEMVGLDAGVSKRGAELGAQREVFPMNIGERNVEGVFGGCVAAKVGKEKGGAERVEICSSMGEVSSSVS